MRRFFKKKGWRQPFRVVRAPGGAGSAEQFVRKQFVEQLQEYRGPRNTVAWALAVMLDGDNAGVGQRLEALDDACRDAGIEPRQSGECVAVFVPTWNIETWLAYLNGDDNVDEGRRDYPSLEREKECRAQVNSLIDMCLRQGLRPPAPPSMRAASREYRALLTAARGDDA